MSVHAELGYLAPSDLKELKEQIAMGAKKTADDLGLKLEKSESEMERIAHRFLKNSQLIEKLEDSGAHVDKENTTWTINALGRKVTCHLTSDTYYSHAHKKWDVGIEQICLKIQKYLEGQ